MNFTFNVAIGSGAVGMAHLDGSGVDECVTLMIQRVQDLSLGYPDGRLELQLVGGYSDPRHYSEELFYSLMRKFFMCNDLFLITSSLYINL